MRNKGSALHVINAICNTSWAMYEPWLDKMMEIALRQNPTIEQVEAQLGRPLDNSYDVTVRDGVATIPIVGPIFRYGDFFTRICGGATVDSIATDFNETLHNPAIRAIILDVNSPGGEVDGIAELADMIYAARGEKPIIAYVGYLGASAAYFLAAAADEIVIADQSLLGSIGVIASMPDPESPRGSGKMLTFRSRQSPRKNPSPASEEGRTQIQDMLDQMCEVFVEKVALYRGTSVETVLSDYGQGGVFVGRHAVDAGLADRLGSYEGVLAELIERTNPRARVIGGKRMGAEQTENDLQQQLAEMRQLVEQQNQALAAERTARIKTESDAYVAGQVRDNRLLPAEQSHYTDLYTQLAQDDLATPLTQGSRVDMLRSAIASRPQHSRTQELHSADAAVLEPKGAKAAESEGVSDSRRKELLAKTPEGRAVLKSAAK